MAMEQDYWTQFEPSPMPQTGFKGAEVTPPPYTPGEFGERGFPGPIIPGQDTAGGVAGPGMPAPGAQGGGSRQQFQSAWMQYAQSKPPNVTYVDWLAQFVAANPQYGVTIGGSKRNKIYGPNGEYWAQAVQSAGINGGVAPAWFEGTGESGSGAPGSMGGMDGYGAWTEPFNERYELPSQSDLEHMPGYQAGLKAYRGGIESSAAAKGTLLTGGTLQRLGQASTDYANQAYGQLAGLQGGAFDRNYNIFRNNQTDPFNKMYSLAELGRPR